MKKNQWKGPVKIVCALAIVVLAVAAVVQLGAGEARAAKDPVCPAQTNCGPSSPRVTCSNGRTYRNICKANAACQYDCQPTN